MWLMGCSGLVSYRTLAESNSFDTIRVFERDEVPGGNWHYTDEIPNTVPIPEQSPKDWWRGDYTPTHPDRIPFQVRHNATGDQSRLAELETVRKNHRQPKPIWKTLHANTPAPQQQVSRYLHNMMHEDLAEMPRFQASVGLLMFHGQHTSP
jgi:hypothetical protein